jgi:hypothetical protein
MANMLGTAKLGLIGGGILAAGAFTGYRSFENNPDEEQRYSRAASEGASGALAATGVIGAGYLATVGIKRKANGIGSKQITLPKAFNSAEPITKASLKAFATKPLVMGGGLAAVGGLIGSQVDPDHPGQGAAIGAAGGGVTGVALSYGMKGKSLWKKIGPIGRGGAILGLALGVGAIARTYREPQYERSDKEVTDGYGDYFSVSDSGVKERLNTMNASGDVVLGLNRRRRL